MGTFFYNFQKSQKSFAKIASKTLVGHTGDITCLLPEHNILDTCTKEVPSKYQTTTEHDHFGESKSTLQDVYEETSHAKSAKVLCDLDNFTKIYVDSSWRVGPPMENPLSCSNLNCLVLICNFIIVVLTTTWLKLSRQYSHLLINYKFHNFLQKEKTFHKSESHVIINCSEMDSKFLRNGKSILEILEKGFFELPF